MSQPILLRRTSVSGKVPTTTDLALGELAVNTTDGKLFLKKSSGGNDSIVTVGDAATTATKLATARTIALSGDATGSVSFDGSANRTITVTLASTGVSAGTYNRVTVDAKGRVTAASNVAYLTAESDTFASVTGRGASTATALSITNETAATSKTTGALVVAGGVGIGGSAYATRFALDASGYLTLQDGIPVLAFDSLDYITYNRSTDTFALVTSGSTTVSVTASSISLRRNVSITESTASTSTGTGALTVTGGVGIGGNLNVGGNLAITGNLTINGTTTTVNSTTVTVDDPIITLGGDTAPTTDDNKDRGIEFRWHNGTAAKVGFFGFDKSTGYLTFIPDATNTNEVFSGTKGTIDANLNGNASTATKLATARSIALSGDVTGSTTFDGSANRTITITLASTGVTAGTYAVPAIAVDAKGRITSISSTAFTQTGSGAVARSVLEKLGDFVSVRDFGAKGDGVSDDTAAINAAETALEAAGGGILYFPAGTYITTGLVKRGRTIWQGAGIGGVQGNHQPAGGTIIRLKAGTAIPSPNGIITGLNAASLFGGESMDGIYGWGLRDMVIDGNVANGATGNGLIVYGGAFELSNVEICNFSGIGMRCESGIPGVTPHGYNHLVSLYNVLVHDCDSGGIRWGGPSDSTFVGLLVYRNQYIGFETYKHGSGLKFTSCHAWSSVFEPNKQHTVCWRFNTPGNMMSNCTAEGASVSQIQLLESANVIVGGRMYYYSDSTDTYGITIGAPGFPSANNVIITRIEECRAGAIYFANATGGDTIEVDGSQTGGLGYTGFPSPNSYIRFNVTGASTNSSVCVIPSQAIYISNFPGGGHVTYGAPDSGGPGYRVLRVPN